MRADVLPHLHEPQPHTVFLGREVRIEDSLLVIRGDTGTVVEDLERDGAAGLTSGDLDAWILPTLEGMGQGYVIGVFQVGAEGKPAGTTLPFRPAETY